MSGKTFPKIIFSRDVFHRCSVKSFFFNLLSCCCVSGPTEREILQHLEEIVELALPLDKFKKPYKDVNTAKNLILNRVTFCQARVDVSKKRLLFLYLQIDLTSYGQVHW